MTSLTSHNMGVSMGVWQIQEAKSKFSQVINLAISGEPQEITKNGKTVAFIVSSKEYSVSQKPSFKDTLRRFPYPDVDLAVERSKDHIRNIKL